RLVSLAVLQGGQDRRVVVRQLRAVGGEMVHDLTEPFPDDGPRVQSENRGGGRIDEGDVRVRVDAEDAFAGRLDEQRGLRERPLVEPPGDDAADTGPEDEERVDAGPRPRRVERRLVVV